MQWIPTSVDRGLPNNPVFVGNDSDGSPIFVGRLLYKNEHCVAKVIPSKRIAYISFNGEEISTKEFEVLTELYNYSWIQSSNGEIPSNAILSGRTMQGEPIFIGRTNHLGSTTPGKILQSHKCLYFPYNGKEESTNNYEVLVGVASLGQSISVSGGGQLGSSITTMYQWIPSNSQSPFPQGAHVGGSDVDNTTIYVGRADHEGMKLPAKIIPSKRVAYVSHNGSEIIKNNYEVLCHGNIQWRPYIHNHGIPAKPIVSGYTHSNETIYIGRGPHNGSLTVGKFMQNQNILLIPFGGSEIPIYQNIEILCEM